MPRKVARKERGVFEKEPGSDIWWIRYKIDGVERCEKVGRRGGPIKLYQVRRSDALRGVKSTIRGNHPFTISRKFVQTNRRNLCAQRRRQIECRISQK
jgi:hypothetical protein